MRTQERGTRPQPGGDAPLHRDGCLCGAIRYEIRDGLPQYAGVEPTRAKKA